MVLILGWSRIPGFDVAWLKSNSGDSWMDKNELFPISKYRHLLFRISRYPKMKGENSSLDYIQNIKKLLESIRI